MDTAAYTQLRRLINQSVPSLGITLAEIFDWRLPRAPVFEDRHACLSAVHRV